MYKCMDCDVEMERNTFVCTECYRKKHPKEDTLANVKNKETRIAYDQEIYGH